MELQKKYSVTRREFIMNVKDLTKLTFFSCLFEVLLIQLCSLFYLQEWNDMNLRWNSSDYGGVRDLRIPPHRLWKPDVLMYNR
jgi:hypothetical protein